MERRSRLEHKLRLLLGVVLLAAGGAGGIFQCLTARADESGAPLEVEEVAPAEELYLDFGPYVQNVSPNQATVMFHLSRPGFASVRYKEVEAGAWRQAASGVQGEPSCQHEVRLEGLTLDSLHRYEVLARENLDGQWRNVAGGVFQTAPVEPRPFKFAVYGDSRSNPELHAKIARAIAEEKPEFVLSTGDLVMSGGSLELWITEFFKPASEYLDVSALWPCLGNHEESADLYFNIMALPNNERWYSFDWANAHFVVLDSNSDMTPGSSQYRWFEEDLSKTEKPWKFVMFHHPAFSSGLYGAQAQNGRPADKAVRDGADYIVPLAEKYGAAIIFWGHDHIYERSIKGDLVCVTTGGGGAPLNPITQGQNPYSVVAKSVHHYCLVEVKGDRLNLKAKDLDGNVVDEFELERKFLAPKVGGSS